LGGRRLIPDCQAQAELNAQWVKTVRTNGWALLPLWVGLQAPCRSNTTKKAFTSANARRLGQVAAKSAVAVMRSLGLGPHKPIYLDLEPYDTSKARCDAAVVDFVEAWTNALHRRHYVAGVYAHATQGVEPIALNARPLPDDIWWALWNGRKSTYYPTLHGKWLNHRIHQYAAQGGSQMTSHHGQAMQIDRNSIDADVVGAYVARTPAGPPFAYRASPPAGLQLQERTSPDTNNVPVTADNYGARLRIQCQTTGQNIYGDKVWDLLADGNYVADLYTTTTGRLGFTPGIPQCQ
ncbi:MAG: DUF1906 domain-containing protein, partial [Frankiales bacterium]|nr:DUF1906 domain-containing protein [Frankiales bacterium]